MIKLNAAARIKAAKNVNLLADIVQKVLGVKGRVKSIGQYVEVDMNAEDAVDDFKGAGWTGVASPKVKPPAVALTKNSDVIEIAPLGNRKVGIGYRDL